MSAEVMTEEVVDKHRDKILGLGESLAKKWPDLCDGLDGVDRSYMGILLQNEEDHLRTVRPQVTFRDKDLQETTKVLNIGGFDKFAS